MEIVNIQLTSPVDESQVYDNKDLSLIQSARISRPFGRTEDYIEYFIYDVNGEQLANNYFANSYTPVNVNPADNTYSTLQISPEADIRAEGFDRGTVLITYNFFRKLFRSDLTQQFWIKEISSDRTEIRVCRQDLSNQELQQAFNDYDNQISAKAYYPDFYLNFGDNNVVIGVNVLYALQNEEACLLIKLYEPLADNVQLKDTFWIVDKLSDSVTYEVDIQIPVEVQVEQNTLRGPNYNVSITERINQTIPVYNLSTLFQTTVSASYQQIKSLMEEKGLDINVDYTDFSNFVHFSSATERIYNFLYKQGLIESYQADINALTSVAGSGNAVITSGSKAVLQAKINNIIEKFDGYEYYLYFESGSNTWPKSTSTLPYQLYSVTSSQVSNWLGGPEIEPSAGVYSILYSASLYDINNKDWLLNTIPQYLRDDSDNQPYELFLNMIGQHFDNIWVYLKDVTERFDAENSLIKGISKDLVGEALKGLGINLYTNTSISDNLYYSLLGINGDGSTLPPTGSEIITQYITSSISAGGTNTLPGQDITLEYYKRIYHNLPYLLKTRGTTRGLRALITCFGIPDTILRINEFGGSDKLSVTPDLIQNRHSLAYDNEGRNRLDLPWAGQNLYFVSASNKNIVPDTIEFRFKTDTKLTWKTPYGFPTGSQISQSLFQVNSNSNTVKFGVNLIYDSGSAVPSSSYQYNGDMRLYLSGAQGFAVTPPITLPFFQPDQWFNVMIKRETGSFVGANNSNSNRYWLYVKGATYNEEGNGEITYEASQSIYVDGATSASYNASWNTFNTSSTTNLFRAHLGGNNSSGILSANSVKFDGYFQEFRYWAIPLPEEAFDEHVINSTSYRGSSTTSSLYELTFRLPLGSNLNVPYRDIAGSVYNPKDYDLYELGLSQIDLTNDILNSYHPAVTGSFRLPFNNQVVNGVGSIISNTTVISYGRFAEVPTFIPYTIADLIPTPSTGPNQKVNNKVQLPEENYLSESLLSPHISIQEYNSDMSRNSPNVEVGFSPSDVLDLDITNQLGYFNIDEYIGAPSDAYRDTYPDLSTLRTQYYQKYLSKYNVWDFIRLIKYFDNSLFKMIKDYVPARSNLSTGIIVKPTLLERPKYPRNIPQAQRENNVSGSIEMISITGSNPEALYLNTAYTQSIVSPLGTVTRLKTDLREPVTGEFSGSTILVTNGLFPQTDISSIEGNWTSSIVGGNAIFTTYSLNPLLNNVSGSRRSMRFLQTDYSSNIIVPVNNNLITGALALYQSRSIDPLYTGLDSPYWPFAEIQDYYYQLYSRQNIRYQGSKTISLKYNVYSSASAIWTGDQSYGKTAAIDRNSEKIGWVRNIPSQSLNFPDKTIIYLKYLVDENRNLTELSARNYNLFDVQNIFKSGDDVTVSITNVQKPTNQVSLDGNKKIFKGGFFYDPILFREANEALTFRYDTPISSSTSNPVYKARAVDSYLYYSNAVDDNGNDARTGLQAPPTLLPGVDPVRKYKYVSNKNDQRFTASPISYIAYDSNTWKYRNNANPKINLTFTGGASRSAPYVYGFNILDYNRVEINTNQPAYEPDPGYIYKAPRTGLYALKGSIPLIFFKVDDRSIGRNPTLSLTGTLRFKLIGIVEKATNPNTSDDQWTLIATTTLRLIDQGTGGTVTFDAASNLVEFDLEVYNSKFSCDLNELSIALNEGDYLRFNFWLIDYDNAFGNGSADLQGTKELGFVINSLTNPTLSTLTSQKAYFEIKDTQTVFTDYVTTSTYTGFNLLSTSSVAGQENNLIFDSTIIPYIVTQSTFVPQPPTSQYYSPVIDYFSIQRYDLIRIGSFSSPKVSYYEVKNVNTSSISYTIPGNFNYVAGIIGSGFAGRNDFSYAYTTQYPVNLFKVGDNITITGTTGGLNDITATVGAISIVGPDVRLTLSTAVQNQSTQTITVTLNNRPYNLIAELTSNIDTGSFDSQNFAILRPKANETSVIINHRKVPGEVSQTLLLPQDISTRVRSQVGDIFNDVNTNVISTPD